MPGASGARAQADDPGDGFRLRAHLGAGHVAALVERDDVDAGEVGLVGGLGADWPLSERVRLGVGFERHRLFEGAPDAGRPSEPLHGVLGTSVLLAELEWRSGRFHLRPGVGFSYHRFGSEREEEGRLVFHDVSGEAGVAGGLAAGAEVGRSGPFTFLIEALARWTDGEDSTAGRRLLAVTAGVAVRP